MLRISPIDRHAEVRDDKKLIEESYRLESSQILIWHKGEILTLENKTHFFSYADIHNHRQIFSFPIYLGKHQDKAYFASHLDHWHDDFSQYQPANLRTAGLYANEQELGLLFYSQGLLNWHNNHNYCSCCGGVTEFAKSGHSRICKNIECAREHFPRIEPAVIFAVENRQIEPKLLLARQASWDENRYSVLAGFVEPGESLEHAVAREGFEEVGLNINNVKYVASQPWPFPSSLMLGFECETSDSEVRLIDQELEKAMWVTSVEMEAKINSGELKLPFSVSISWYLIDRWFTQQTGRSLKSIVKQ